MTKKFNIAEKITQTVIDAIKTNKELPWQKPWAGGSDAFPMNGVSKKPYRGFNIFLLSWAGFSDNRWYTANQINKLGGKIEKGTKANQVTFWNFIKSKTEFHGDGTPKEFPMLRYYNVFNHTQTDLPQDVIIPEDMEFDVIEEAQSLADSYLEAQGIKLTNQEQKAYYSPSSDRINMPTFQSFDRAESYYATLFHEIGHSTGHKDRLKRELSMDSHEYSKEELTAEMASAMICSYVGISDAQLQENTEAYLLSWIKKLEANPKWLISAGGQAQKAMDFVIEHATVEVI